MKLMTCHAISLDEQSRPYASYLVEGASSVTWQTGRFVSTI